MKKKDAVKIEPSTHDSSVYSATTMLPHCQLPSSHIIYFKIISHFLGFLWIYVNTWKRLGENILITWQTTKQIAHLTTQKYVWQCETTIKSVKYS